MRPTYLDHLTETLNYARHLYALHARLGRPLAFSLADALLVLWLHDKEKPERIIADEGGYRNSPTHATKAGFKVLRARVIAAYGLKLTDAQENALQYVEGEGEDYSSKRRVMGELAAFCHQVDVWSARQYPDYPKARDDEWRGAQRFRQKPSPPSGALNGKL